MLRSVALSVFSLLLAACSFTSSPAAESLDLAPTATQAPAATPSGQTYTDPYAGFSFTYPEGWFINAPDDTTMQRAVSYVVTIQSFEPGIGSGGIPADGQKMDIYVTRNTPQTTVDAIQARLQQEAANNTGSNLNDQRITLDGGFEVLVIQGDSDSAQGVEFITVYTIVNGTEVAVSGLNVDPVPLAHSLRATG
jgi:hypothetical protein